MNIADINFALPEELIAQTPAEPRDSSRMLILDKSDASVRHKSFVDIVEELGANDVLVLNNSKVLSSRLLFEWRGKQAEILLLNQVSDKLWRGIGRPGKMLKTGEIIEIDGLYLKVIDSEDLSTRLFEVSLAYDDLMNFMAKRGVLPLPPYIKSKLQNDDQYQTVYSKCPGSVAAPTAGLHFTERVMSVLREKGVEILEITLHVGLGTFLPIKGTIEEHVMHEERYSIVNAVADSLNDAITHGKRIVAVGSTSTRVLESNFRTNGKILSGNFTTDIFIKPGYEFKVVDAMLTNFHLPNSTLLLLVGAFAGMQNMQNAYRLAIDERYRFFSFGDAMFIK